MEFTIALMFVIYVDTAFWVLFLSEIMIYVGKKSATLFFCRHFWGTYTGWPIFSLDTGLVIYGTGRVSLYKCIIDIFIDKSQPRFPFHPLK